MSTFADGVRYRIEIPSVEGPAVLRAVLEEAERRDVPVRRVSQGSGVMMLTDSEIRELATLGAAADVEVSLFLGARGAWDTGGQSLDLRSRWYRAGWRRRRLVPRRGRRGLALGIRSFLVAAVGVLATLGRMKRDGKLPDSLVLAELVLRLLREQAPRPRRGTRGRASRRPRDPGAVSGQPASARGGRGFHAGLESLSSGSVSSSGSLSPFASMS